MGKYTTKKKKKKITAGKIILLVVLALLLAAMIWLISILKQQEIPVLEDSSVPTEMMEVPVEQTEEVVPSEAEVTEPEAIALGEGLQILHIGSYAGMYMEDGTNEPVADVMMVILKNAAEQDLQLARINIAYSDFTAEFEATNLPAGERVVLLEKNRHAATAEEYQNLQLKNVVYFQEKMNLQEDRIRIKGHNGTLEVTNLSGEDISGDIYIYYKHSASDLLYGGITYRVAIRGGLKAGQSNMVIAGHYTPETCRILQVSTES